jgi:mannitol 2-dehydrogenase
VSLTITEGGYNVHAVTGAFDLDEPGVRDDLRPGAVPRTTFGLVTEALERRRASGIPPFAVMSCDNIQANGDVARHSFAAFAAARDAELGRWVEREVRFPNSMVDRITPVTTDDDRVLVRDRFGVEDRWPVVCEPFAQWVLEDILSERPPLEAVGVQLVADVEPYELMKLRLLNGSHQALGYLGALAGRRLVHDVAQDPLFAAFLLGYMDEEATPTLAPLPGIDLHAYTRELIARFSNAHVEDTVARLCAESSDRIPKFVLPVLRHNLATGGEIRHCAAVVAGWARYVEGVDEAGGPIEVVDRLRDRLRSAARRETTQPGAFLRENRDLFGDLVDDARFVEAYTTALASLRRDGTRATLERLRAGG